MKISKSKFSSGLFVFLMSTMAGFSAQADDTEIFFGGASNSAVRPNILFILDTSGSMGYYDNQSLHRLDRMKNAFYDLLSGMNNVNVGLMRFNDPGGPILYPVTNIDEQLPAASPYNGLTSSTISSTDGDAEQDNATGTVVLSNYSLEMNERVTVGSVQTATVYVNKSSDDAEETVSDGSIITDSPSLESPIDDGNKNDKQITGVIFRSLGIPKNAVIQNAYLTFDIYERGNGSDLRRDNVDLRISAQLGSTIASFSNLNNMSSRSKTTNKVLWEVRESPKAQNIIETPNITAVVQELVQQSTWTNTSDAAFFLQYAYNGDPTGSRDFASYDTTSSFRKPKLTVLYQAAGSSSAQTVGLRFTELDVPRGVTITSAKVEFTAARDSSTATTLNIRGEAADNSAPFQATINNLSRTFTTNTVNWTPATSWQKNQTYQTADLKDIVQEITNRTGWCGGNALSLLIDGSGNRPAISYDGSGSDAPKLIVEYDASTIPADGSCVSSSLSYRINSASDDVEHIVGGTGAQTTNGKILTLGYDGSNKQAVGLRFNNIAVARNASISSAYLEFKASGSDSVTSNFTIYAESADNPNTYSDARKANGLTAIGTTVAWNSVASWTQGQTYRSPDISPLIQAIVNRPGWNQGNAVSIIIKTSTANSSRDAASFDESAYDAPRLVLRASGKTTDFVPTTRDAIREIISDLSASGNTPIVDALYEAALYYRGSNVLYGKTRGDSGANDSSRKYFRVSHPGSYTGGTHSYPSGCSSSNLDSTNCIGENISGTPVYKSPITDQCQTNHIVLLTDGEPTRNDSANLIKTLTGKTSCVSYGDSDYNCGEELSEFLYTSDQSSNVIDVQKIKTHTIGFNFSDDNGYLTNIATKGGGGSYAASSSAELLSVFQRIVGPALELDTTFVSPGVTVNSFNRLNHRNEVYFSLFQPKETEYWPGNLKRYKLTSAGDIMDNDSPAKNAINSTTGYFRDDAVSYWASVVDGNDTTKGGAALQLPTYANRKIYTHYSGASNLLTDNPVSVANKANITKDRLGIGTETDAYHDNLINWIRGQDLLDSDEDGSTTDDRKQLGDPLHSSPYLVTYGGTEASPDITVFYGDNEGALHAVNATTGAEQFAFIPGELLPNLDKLYRNTGENNHLYGLDGQIAAWIKDVNANSIIESADNDHVYIYVGMRRGGRNYYALNTTNRNSPRMLWTITGGSGDFVKMGQTWARPIKTKINVDGTITDVLIISGGYDKDQDSANVRTADDIGNAMYIVNAATGSLIWSASNQASYDLNLSDMQYSIPSTVRAIDVDADGVTDQFYVGDMGGQIWRFDVHNGNAVDSLVTAGVIADFGGSTAAEARRFYHEPDVSVLVKNNQRLLAISIGSGFQAHPLNSAIDDQFYMVLQSALASAPADTDSDGKPNYVKLTHSDLYDTTSNIIENGTDTEKSDGATSLSSAQGWYIDLFGEYNGSTGPGEKTLARALTLNGVLYFTTYQPDVIASASCTATDTAVRKLYSINLSDASPTVVGTETSDRYNFLKSSGIPSAPVHVRITDTDGTKDLVGVGTEFTDASSGDIVTKTFWYSF